MAAFPIRLCALVVAGGTGTRLGAGMPKQMLPLAGRPILAHTLDRFLEFDPGMLAMCVLHPSLLETWPDFVRDNFDEGLRMRMLACAGGSERTESVHNGLKALLDNGFPADGLVAIHDAVRPFIGPDMLMAGYGLAQARGNAVAGVPVKSSLRMKTENGSQAVDRSHFFHVQTPQVFHLGEILACYEKRPEEVLFTDDASLAEQFGMEIQLFDGHYDNIKITTLEDLIVAEQMMARKQGRN